MATITMPLTDARPHEAVLRADVRAFLAAERAAQPELFAHRGYDLGFTRRLAGQGWVGMMIPRQFGGGGRSAVEQFVVAEELLASGAPLGAHHAADRQTAPMLLRYGTEAQQERFLPGIADGSIGFALGMSEPDAGSDLAAVRTRAHRVEGGWAVSGTKVWTSWAQYVPWAIVLCRTSPKAESKHEGLSQLIIDLRGPGVAVHPIVTLDGRAHFCEVVLDEAFGPDELVLGEVGNGWRQVNAELAYERAGPDRWLSTFRVYRALVAIAARRPDASTAALAGRCAAWYRTLHELSYGIARRVSEGGDPATEAAVVKDLGTAFEQQVLELGRTALDGAIEAGDAAELAAELAELVLVAPGFTIRGGSTEILRTVISRGLLR
jgi:alkylation response protein AidB-like acyl-CoA dehydrogenase